MPTRKLPRRTWVSSTKRLSRAGGHGWAGDGLHHEAARGRRSCAFSKRQRRTIHRRPLRREREVIAGLLGLALKSMERKRSSGPPLAGSHARRKSSELRRFRPFFERGLRAAAFHAEAPRAGKSGCAANIAGQEAKGVKAMANEPRTVKNPHVSLVTRNGGPKKRRALLPHRSSPTQGRQNVRPNKASRPGRAARLCERSSTCSCSAPAGFQA